MAESEFTKKWRIKHGEPLTYNERIVNSACDIIEQQDERIMALRKTKCPPISEGDSCICPIEELEERIKLAIGGIDALSGDWDEETKKDILAIKQTLEATS